MTEGDYTKRRVSDQVTGGLKASDVLLTRQNVGGERHESRDRRWSVRGRRSVRATKDTSTRGRIAAMRKEEDSYQEGCDSLGEVFSPQNKRVKTIQFTISFHGGRQIHLIDTQRLLYIRFVSRFPSHVPITL